VDLYQKNIILVCVVDIPVNLFLGDSFSYNNNMMFTTSDRDNDMDVDNCATSRSPWWNNMCSRCFLAGRYGEYPTVPEDVGIKWQYDWGTTKFAKYAIMMIRPN